MISPAKKIAPTAWMQTPEAKAVMAALSEKRRMTALFVGGCVRNTLMGQEVSDIDIATVLTPPQVIERLKSAGITAVPTGIEHGTVTGVVNKKPFEITTLRRDVETDGRRATIAFTEDWREDAARRDFTINTLLADAEGNIYDPLGEGLKDLEKRQVVFAGEPAQRIAEDYLRILRFFRFHALYGKGQPEVKALAACKAAADKIALLSVERVTQEFFKILSVDNPVTILNIMFENNVLKDFVFKEYQPAFMRWFCDFQGRYGLVFLASRLLVLAGLKEENVSVLDKKLLIPKVFKKDIEAICEVLKLPDLSDDHAVKVAVYKFGRVATAQALMIELAQDRVMNGYAPKALQIIQKWDIPDFPVNGDDLMQAGIKAGPELGRKLSDLEEYWIEKGFQPGKKELLGFCEC